MSGPLESALSTLSDAERARRMVTDTALSSWSDAAQRAFWDRILDEVDRETRQYQAAATVLDEQLRNALNMLDN